MNTFIQITKKPSQKIILVYTSVKKIIFVFYKASLDTIPNSNKFCVSA